MTVILRPLINEKSMGLTRTGFYTFEVARSSTKEQIAAIVTEKFKVKVVSVNTINRIGKTKTQRTRKGYFQQPHLKKAIVKVEKGAKIALFEQVTADMGHAGHNHDEVEVRTAEGEVLTSVKEKKSLLRGTKVKIEEIREEGHRGPIKGGDKAEKGAK
jgi:large subunit ribosomal protein L23